MDPMLYIGTVADIFYFSHKFIKILVLSIACMVMHRQKKNVQIHCMAVVLVLFLPEPGGLPLRGRCLNG